MEKNEEKAEPQMLYVITAKTSDIIEATKEIANDFSGVLRVFANKEDAKAYMFQYYNETAIEHCSISLQESKNGILNITVGWYDDVSLGSDREWQRTEILECQTIELTKNLKIEKSTVMDDIATVLWGM